MTAITVRLRNEANTTTTAALTGAFDVRFQRRRNAPGTGSFRLLNSDPAQQTVTRGSVVQFVIGSTARFAARVKEKNPSRVSEPDEDAESTEFLCDGLLADFDMAAVQLDQAFGGIQCDLIPSLDERVWNWAGNDFDEVGAGWGFARQIATQGWEQLPAQRPCPAGFTDPVAPFVWGNPGTDTNAPPGMCLFKQRVVVGQNRMFLDWTCDNYGELYINGRRVQDAADLRQKSTYQFTTTGGVVVIAFLVVNLDPSFNEDPEGPNPGSLIGSMRVDSPEGAVLWRTSTSMRCLSYPSAPPKIPVGKVLRDVRDDNGVLSPLWTFNFTNTADSDGTAWPTVDEFTGRLYDDSALDVVNAMTEVWMDVDVEPSGKVLNAYVQPHGTTSSLELVTGYSTEGQADPDSVNVAELAWRTEWSRFDRLAVRWSDGWFDLGAPLGNRWASLRIEQVNTLSAAAEIGNRMLALNSVDRPSATLRYVPIDASQEPFVAFDVGDTLNVPGLETQDATTPQKVWAVTASSDENGEVEWVVEVGSPVLDEVERFDRALRRAGPGGLAGYAASASASSGKAPYASADKLRLMTPSSGATTHVIASMPNARPSASSAFAPFVGRVVTLRLVGDGYAGTGVSTVWVNDGSTLYVLEGSGNGVIDTVDIGKTWTTRTTLTVAVVGADENAVRHDNLHVYADVGDIV